MEVVSGAARRLATYFVFVVYIMARCHLAMEVMVVAFLAACWIVGFRIAGTQYRQFGGRCTQNTHPQRARRAYSLFTSTHECDCVHVAPVKIAELYHLCATKRFQLQVSHVTHMLVVPTPSHLRSINHSTQHYLDRATFSKTTLYTDNHFRKNLFSLFQNNFLMSPYQQTQSGRKTTLKHHFQILKVSVPETCASTLPQLFRATGDLICDQKEITGLKTTDVQEATWMQTSLLCE